MVSSRNVFCPRNLPSVFAPHQPVGMPLPHEGLQVQDDLLPGPDPLGVEGRHGGVSGPVLALLDVPDVALAPLVALPDEDGGPLADHDPAGRAHGLGDEGEEGEVGAVLVGGGDLADLADAGGLK